MGRWQRRLCEVKSEVRCAMGQPPRSGLLCCRPSVREAAETGGKSTYNNASIQAPSLEARPCPAAKTCKRRCSEPSHVHAASNAMACTDLAAGLTVCLEGAGPQSRPICDGLGFRTHNLTTWVVLSQKTAPKSSSPFVSRMQEHLERSHAVYWSAHPSACSTAPVQGAAPCHDRRPKLVALTTAS
jgi:hypothetical protein